MSDYAAITFVCTCLGITAGYLLGVVSEAFLRGFDKR